VTVKDRRRWENKHHTFRQRIERLYDVWNPDVDAPSAAGLRATVEALQAIIGDALREDMRLRALGSGWSFSKVAATEGWLINTKPLNWLFSVLSGSVSPDYTGAREHLLVAQCGASIQELNRHLAGKHQSLKTCGASNGQTIVGAFSTGTHGSAIDVGAVQDYVVGLHLIVGPSRHVWLERASYPVVSDVFADKLGAELIRDDVLFDSALVSFGSFGIIHAVMIETEDLFHLEASRRRMPFDDRLKEAVRTLDFSTLPLPEESERPYHFEVVVNPYDIENGAYVTVMYKRPFQSGAPRREVEQGGLRPGDNAPAFIGVISDAAPSLLPGLVNGLFGELYAPYEHRIGTLGEMFGSTSIRGKATGSALGVPLASAWKALETALAVHDEHGPFAALVALRFVKGTQAELGFTRFDTTCIVDLDGVTSRRTSRFFEHVWGAFEDAGIPFTMHWGKDNGYLDADRVRRMYGSAHDRWLASRHTLLEAASRTVFSNAFLDRCGLAD
jgi:FAD/FMN-containing dehydrogenase